MLVLKKIENMIAAGLLLKTNKGSRKAVAKAAAGGLPEIAAADFAVRLQEGRKSDSSTATSSYTAASDLRAMAPDAALAMRRGFWSKMDRGQAAVYCIIDI